MTSMDRTVDPCVDFFQYSCGGWIKNNPIPPDQSSWDTYSKMQDENRARLRGILEAAAAPDPARNAATQKIGDYYSSCMDEKAIEAKGAEPLKAEAGSNRARSIPKTEIADIAAAMIDDNVLFRFDSNQDYRDASQDDRQRGPGRARPARPRLLPERRCQIGRSAQELIWRTCRRCSNCWATAGRPQLPKRKP